MRGGLVRSANQSVVSLRSTCALIFCWGMFPGASEWGLAPPRKISKSYWVTDETKTHPMDTCWCRLPAPIGLNQNGKKSKRALFGPWQGRHPPPRGDSACLLRNPSPPPQVGRVQPESRVGGGPFRRPGAAIAVPAADGRPRGHGGVPAPPGWAFPFVLGLLCACVWVGGGGRLVVGLGVGVYMGKEATF